MQRLTQKNSNRGDVELEGKKSSTDIPKEKQWIIYATYPTIRNKHKEIQKNHKPPQKSNRFLQTGSTGNSGQAIFCCCVPLFRKAELAICCTKVAAVQITFSKVIFLPVSSTVPQSTYPSYFKLQYPFLLEYTKMIIILINPRKREIWKY